MDAQSLRPSGAGRRRRASMVTFGAMLAAAVVVVANVAVAQVAAPVGLGTAASFAVLAGPTVTNTGPTTIDGNVGVWPGNTTPGLLAGQVNGVIHLGDAVAQQAQSDLTTAYNDAAGRPFTLEPVQLGGLILPRGVYRSPGTYQITGTLTLDAGGDPNAVFIFQTATTLVTASFSRVLLVNGASPCNVFWQVGSSATLGTFSTFVGTIMALQQIAAQTGAEVQGRLLARNAQVTLDSNRITRPLCATTGTTTNPTPTPTLPGGIPLPPGVGPGVGPGQGPGGVSMAIGGLPGRTGGPAGDDNEGPGGGTRRARRTGDEERPDTPVPPPAAPRPAPAPTPTPAPPTYGLGSSFLARTPTPGGPPGLAHTGTRTDRELGLAGVALMLGGALVLLGQPPRRRFVRR